MVPTLPGNLTLNDAERFEIEHHVMELDALCAQTPINAAEWEVATLIEITN